jgi:hypothetical protein
MLRPRPLALPVTNHTFEIRISFYNSSLARE